MLASGLTSASTGYGVSRLTPLSGSKALPCHAEGHRGNLGSCLGKAAGILVLGHFQCFATWWTLWVF